MTNEGFEKLKHEVWECAGIAEGQFYFIRNSQGEVIHVGVFEETAKVAPLPVCGTTSIGDLLLNSSRTVIPLQAGRAFAPGDTVQINLSVNS